MKDQSTTLHSSTQPILYSFRRCPYAMRARLAIMAAGICVELREVVLRNKPQAMLDVSPKGTVPVLLLADGTVIDESLDIMHWALGSHDPHHWLPHHNTLEVLQLITRNDGEFKYFLDRYKYADRYPDRPATDYRQQGEVFLGLLETCLQQSDYLTGKQFAFADAAIAPFIRQFATVDPAWFERSPYPRLRQWLQAFVTGNLFNSVMDNYQPWQPDSAPQLFGAKPLA